MNKVILEKVDEINEWLGRILGTVSGNFSIEQQVLSHREYEAVLLKIYQLIDDDDGKKEHLFALVIDTGGKVGLCTDQILRLGISPLAVKCKPYTERAFKPWLMTELAARLEHKRAA